MIKGYQTLFAYLSGYKKLAYLAIFLAALSAILSTTAFYCFYCFFQQLLLIPKSHFVQYDALLGISLMIGGACSYFLSGVLSHIVAFRLETNLRKKGIDGLLVSQMAYFDQHSSGMIRRTIDDNAAETHAIIAHLIPDNVVMLITPLLIIVFAFKIDVFIGLSLLILLGIGACLVKGMMGEIEMLNRYMKALDRMTNETVEYIRGIPVIKIFKSSIYSFKALYQAIHDYSDQVIAYSFSCRQAYVLFQVIFVVYIVLILPVYLFLLPKQDYAIFIPHLMFLYAVVGLLFNSFMRVMYISSSLYKALTAVSKIETLYAEMTANPVATGKERNFLDTSISFDKVSFAYEGTPVLENLSFTLEKNKIYALVGSSGSGKTTIAKLIAGFYKADSGRVLIGKKPIESYDETALMRQIAFVFQQSKLLKRSIFDNVKIGNPQATDEQVMAALGQASCQDILAKFPQRERTLIGASGVHLSGGEMQRIAIARAILKDAPIVILDEASAATDVLNEYRIQQAFARLIRHKTVLIIAHRLSSIRGVDEILVVENGQIIERGTDEVLTARSGRYKALKALYQVANDWRTT